MDAAPSRGSSTATRTRALRAIVSRSSRCARPARRYEELHAAGGGILSTVATTRAAGPAGLAAAVERHRGWMLAHGTTTFEAKSGYGLDHDTELASLEAIAAAGGIPTFLGAHAVPPERGDADAYVDWVIADVLPDAARVAAAADVFLERGAFDAAQARRYLVAARDAGLDLRLHGDQFTEAGAIPLAIELGARSVDHLEATGPEGVAALADSDVVGVLLPASALSSAGRCRRHALSSTPAPRSRSRRTSTRGAPSARACRSSRRSPACLSACRPPRR